jgi:molybdate-binding protein/DNA-binding XRE family transcriptional regulator
MSEIQTALGKLRRQRGISAVELATAVGVRRQTIYAMEAGTYVPNTAVALRLARALGSTVEELFALADEDPAPPRAQRATLLPDAPPPQPGQAVQLCQVDKRLIAALPSPIPWYLPATDAIVSEAFSEPSPKAAKAAVRIFAPEGDFSNRILVAGCDPAISVLSRHVAPAGIDLVLIHRNSTQSLGLLRDGYTHIAGTHLRDEAGGESNLPAISRLFRKSAVAVVSFAVWEVGILTAPGNPKAIRGVADLAEAGCRIINREPGAGSRALLDSELKKLSIPPTRVAGYDNEAPGHLAAAWQVQSGAADACIATRAAARAFGLDFVSLGSERYDFAIRREHLELPRIQNLLDILNRRAFRRELDELGGYDSSVAGRRII